MIIISLFDYLYGFISRTRPLLNIDQQLEEIEQVRQPAEKQTLNAHHDLLSGLRRKV